MDPISHFTALARYNAWATGRVLDAIDPLPDAEYRRDMGLFFRSIHGTLNHLLVGEQQLWWLRFSAGLSPKIALDAEAETDRVQLAQRLRAGCARWEPFIQGVSPARWAGTLDYTTMRGQPASLPFALTLSHVFNHSTHHRGQITAALTAMGQPGPELDLVYYLQTHPTP